MPLSDTKIRSAKPGEKPRKLADERGLYLLIQPSGSKLWKLKYRFHGKELKLSLGIYPDVSLQDARVRRDEAKALIASDIDPGHAKKAAAQARGVSNEQTFGLIAEEYLDRASREGRAAVTIGKSRWLISLMTKDLGQRPISEITPSELLAAIRKVEAKGHLETARRMRSLAGRVFRYAVATSRADSDPSSLLKGALLSPKVKHHSALLESRAVGGLLRAIEGYDGQPLTAIALKLSPHLFVRPGELRQAEWQEVDLPGATWTIPAAKTKMRSSHIVPLSGHAVELFHAAHALSAGQRYIFSSMYPGSRPMSENTINAALRRLGYSRDEMTAHGFRALASTLLNESGKWNPDAIERALGHRGSDMVRATYHRGLHWDERVAMANWWSDYLISLRDKI